MGGLETGGLSRGGKGRRGVLAWFHPIDLTLSPRGGVTRSETWEQCVAKIAQNSYNANTRMNRKIP